MDNSHYLTIMFVLCINYMHVASKLKLLKVFKATRFQVSAASTHINDSLVIGDLELFIWD